MAGASHSASASFPRKYCECIRVRFILRCTGLSSRAGSRQSGENQRITGAPGTIRSHALGRSTCASSRPTGTAFLLRLTWCWKHESGVAMRWHHKLPLRLRSIFRRNKADQELNDELQFHLQHQMDEYIARGMTPENARAAALRSLGGMEQIKEQCREVRGVNFIENLLQDLRFGFRMLRRNPGFSFLAILCLTLGIGSNAAVFSWIEGVLFRPFP